MHLSTYAYTNIFAFNLDYTRILGVSQLNHTTPTYQSIHSEPKHSQTVRNIYLFHDVKPKKLTVGSVSS